jgi:TRAP-type C4-dicarboxylate transport system permease small subunit
MQRVDRLVNTTSRHVNTIAGAAVMAMTFLTCADVVMRLVDRPIPGTYEIIGFLGSLAVAFALAQTSVEKGHVAVDLLVNLLPPRMQILMDVFAALTGTAIFGAITWQSALYALDLRQSGEVSATLGMPVYPFVAGIATGCALLCIVLIVEFARSLRRIKA